MCLQPQGILKPYKMDSQGCMLITLDVANAAALRDKMIKKRTKILSVQFASCV